MRTGPFLKPMRASAAGTILVGNDRARTHFLLVNKAETVRRILAEMGDIRNDQVMAYFDRLAPGVPVSASTIAAVRGKMSPAS